MYDFTELVSPKEIAGRWQGHKHDQPRLPPSTRAANHSLRPTRLAVRFVSEGLGMKLQEGKPRGKRGGWARGR
jgi:hypothetical protein